MPMSLNSFGLGSIWEAETGEIKQHLHFLQSGQGLPVSNGTRQPLHFHVVGKQWLPKKSRFNPGACEW